jgi:hypothetical protein
LPAHRYIQRFGYCPGFNLDGTRDPAQWSPNGDILTRAVKDRWADLIARHDLPLPNEAMARAPQFQK